MEGGGLRIAIYVNEEGSIGGIELLNQTSHMVRRVVRKNELGNHHDLELQPTYVRVTNFDIPSEV